MMNQEIRRFREYLRSATAAIRSEYYQLPIAGEDPVYRERVYCYELYHQLRLLQPPNDPFVISGEVDKSGHPLIRGNNLDRSKPDLLVHQPGDMGGNLIAIEVKPFNADRTAVAQDLVKLTAFRRHAGYRAAFLLFYGNSPVGPTLVTSLCCQPASSGIDRSLVEVFLHRAPGEPAEPIVPA